MDPYAPSDVACGEIEIRAMTEQAHCSTYRLIDETDRTAGGTCVAIELDKRCYFATAAHVVPPGHKFKIVLRDSIAPSIDSFSAIERDVEADVAFLEVHPERVGLLSERASFVDRSRLVTTFDNDREQNVIVLGYPGELLDQQEPQSISSTLEVHPVYCSAFTYLTTTRPISDWPHSASWRRPPDLSRDVFLQYTPESKMQVSHRSNAGTERASTNRQPPELPGISGGGIWIEPSQREGDIWSPSLQLLALQVDAKPTDHWLRGTLIDRWLRLIEKTEQLDGASH